MKGRDRAYVWVGLGLVAGFLAQDLLDLEWSWLAERQRTDGYRRWSGLALTLYLAAQWALTALRSRQMWRQAKVAYRLHMYLGILAPVFFYAHAQRAGFAYLLLLSIVFFSTVLIGLANQEVLPFRRRWFADLWILVHVGLSVLLVLLAGYHIFISFYYS